MRWVPQHMNWICQTSSYLLKKQKMHVTEYLQLLLRTDFKFDELAILLYAGMYQIHISIVMDTKYWSTQRDQTIENFENCDVILGFFGNLDFKDTVIHKITAENIVLPPIYNQMHLVY